MDDHAYITTTQLIILNTIFISFPFFSFLFLFLSLPRLSLLLPSPQLTYGDLPLSTTKKKIISPPSPQQISHFSL